MNTNGLTADQKKSLEFQRLSRVANKATDLTRMKGTEADRIETMIAQSTLQWHPSQYLKSRHCRSAGEVPLGYTCKRCLRKGHWVQNCPLGKVSLGNASISAIFEVYPSIMLKNLLLESIMLL